MKHQLRKELAKRHGVSIERASMVQIYSVLRYVDRPFEALAIANRIRKSYQHTRLTCVS